MSKKIPTNNIREAPIPESGNFVFAKNNLFLYQVVYGSAVSAGLVFLLLFSFLVQGVEKVYADELSSEAATLEMAPEEVSEPSADELQETSMGTVAVEEQTDEFDEAAELLVEQAGQESSEIPQESSESEAELVVPEAGDESSTNNEDQSDTSDSAESDSAEVDNGSTESDQATSSVPGVDASAEVLDLSENVTFEAVSYTASDSEFSFNKDECTQLATGSFYCHQPQENTLDDALFSAPDADGDLEIFLVRGGVQTQVTNNNMDDASPYFDQNTNTLVWHRLVDDRFQVISFDIDSGEETQLTRTAENNMEPNRQGDYTVWQRWIDGGWNIILYDGESETQITKTTSHNIAPYIHGSLVVWNRYGSTNEKTIEMYDIQSQSYVSVEDPDGMSVSNPRMVFVYDSLHPNGDIVTKGYDVLARKFIDLDTLPRDLPDELPASDSTGETRALIQSKPSLKSDTKESLEGLGATSTSTFQPMATTSEALTLDLTVAIEPVSQSAEAASSTTPVLDLVIEPYVAAVESTIETVQE